MTSERLKYQPVRAETLDEFHSLVQDGHVRPYLMDGELLSRERSEGRVRDSTSLFDRAGSGSGCRTTPSVASWWGSAASWRSRRQRPSPPSFTRYSSASLGTAMPPRWRGSSIAEARNQGLRTIVADVNEVNVASVRVLEKLGFRRVDTSPGVSAVSSL